MGKLLRARKRITRIARRSLVDRYLNCGVAISLCGSWINLSFIVYCDMWCVICNLIWDNVTWSRDFALKTYRGILYTTCNLWSIAWHHTWNFQTNPRPYTYKLHSPSPEVDMQQKNQRRTYQTGSGTDIKSNWVNAQRRIEYQQTRHCAFSQTNSDPQQAQVTKSFILYYGTLALKQICNKWITVDCLLAEDWLESFSFRVNMILASGRWI